MPLSHGHTAFLVQKNKDKQAAWHPALRYGQAVLEGQSRARTGGSRNAGDKPPKPGKSQKLDVFRFGYRLTAKKSAFELKLCAPASDCKRHHRVGKNLPARSMQRAMRAAMGSTLLRDKDSIRPMQYPINPVCRSAWPSSSDKCATYRLNSLEMSIMPSAGIYDVDTKAYLVTQ